jgi:hypothetical protein
MATLTLTVDLVQCGVGVRQRHSLKRVFLEAQYTLGERMYAAGIDDGQLGAQIAACDREISQSEARSATQVLLAERRKLILLLADAALEEEGPLPGADAEYERARTAQAALHADD